MIMIFVLQIYQVKEVLFKLTKLVFKKIDSENTSPRLVTIKVKVGDGKKINYEELAKAEHLAPVELQARKIEDMAHRVEQDYLYLKNREYIHRDTSGN